MLLSLILVSVGFAPASQAISAPRDGDEYSVAEHNVVKQDQPPGCPIDWKPSVLYPAFAHSEHFDVNNGAPGPLQVFYPSPGPFSDRSYTSLLDCGQYPLVIFLHGHRTLDPDIYKRWTRLPAALARSGYVVVAPKLPYIASGTFPFSAQGDQDLNHAKAALAWMQSGWEHRDHLVRSPGPAIVGHSFGALLGARLAPQIGASAYVSLSAGWKWVDSKDWQTLDDLSVPSLFAWGSHDTEDFAQIDVIPDVWNKIKTVKHKWVFEKGRHWDYLSPSELPGSSDERGPCSLIPALAADYIALFLSRYVPPAGAGIAGLIPPKLIPVPTAARTALQDLFWSGHLEGLKSLPTAGKECQATPDVENLPQYLFDRWGNEVASDAATQPTAAVIPGLGVNNIAYRDTSGHLHELWRTAWDSGTTDLTDNASAPTATGQPFAYVDTSRNTEILLYRSSGGTVHSLYWSLGAVGHDNLSGTATGAPGATGGDPVGYYDAATDTHHVIYRSSNGHLHELWWKGVEPVKYGGDLTALASAPPAEGQPSAFVGGNGANIVIYRSADGHIRSLFWTTGAVAHEDLSGYAGTPPATADPIAYYTAHNDTHQIVYRGNDGRLWELYWQGVAPVVGWDITTLLGAPTAAGTPAAYYSAATNTKHVIYRPVFSTQLHEIVWAPGGWVRAHINLTTAYEAPPANGLDQPEAFTVQAANTQHIAYRGTDNLIYELILR
jgi:alpha/beta superfamily hydrolase